MCRYGIRMYKTHFVCFKCRLAFKDVIKCPQCHESMFRMGHDFKAPPKRDEKWWANVEILAKAGFTFHSCGCTGPGYGGKSKRYRTSILAYKSSILGKRLRGAQEFVNAWFASKFPEELKSPKNGWRKPKIPAFVR